MLRQLVIGRKQGVLLNLAPITERHCLWAAWLSEQRGDSATATAWRLRFHEAAADELFPHGWMTECILRMHWLLIGISQDCRTAGDPLLRHTLSAVMRPSPCGSRPSAMDADPVWWRNLGLALVNRGDRLRLA